MGHTVTRCKLPIRKEKGDDMQSDGVPKGEIAGSAAGWDQAGVTGRSGQPDWESNNVEAQALALGDNGPTAAVGSGRSW